MIENKHGSTNGFASISWGPVMWFLIHLYSFQADLYFFRTWFESLPRVLPCGACRENLPRNLIQSNYDPKIWTSRDMVSQYMWQLHNVVNQCLGKVGPFPPYEHVRSYFLGIRYTASTHIRIQGYDTLGLPSVYTCMRALSRPWWFVCIVVLLNFPLVSNKEMCTVHVNWIMDGISSIPSHCEKRLLKRHFLQVHDHYRQKWADRTQITRADMIELLMSFIRLVYKQKVLDVRDILITHERLRASRCTTSNGSREGSCIGVSNAPCRIICESHP